MAKKVCYTCITGGYDNIPIHRYTDADWDYVLFTDNKELIKQKRVGFWQVRPLVVTKFGNVKNARWHKINAHKLFPDHKYSLWHDGNVSIQNKNIFSIVNKLIDTGAKIAIPKHPFRKCIYQEAIEIKKLRIDTKRIVNRQVRYLKQQSYPENNGLCETNVIFREHNELKQEMNDWWLVVQKFSKRDQLSYNYIAWKYGLVTIPLYNKEGEHRTNGDFVFEYKQTHNQDKINKKRFAILHRIFSVFKNRKKL